MSELPQIKEDSKLQYGGKITPMGDNSDDDTSRSPLPASSELLPSSERRLTRTSVGSVESGQQPPPGWTSRTSIGSRLSRGSVQSSGKVSIRSKTVSVTEYHEDLKVDLKQGLTRNLVLLSLVILMGNTFIYGYNIGVLNQPAELIRQFYNETYTSKWGSFDVYTMTFLWSLTTSLYLPGGMIGAFSAGFLADRLGRKGTVLLACIPTIIGGALSTACVAAKSPELLMFGRFVVGLSCGVSSMICPMYLMEICPFNLRGAFGTASQLFCTLGLFVGSVLGLREMLGTEDRWPYLELVNIVAAFFCLVTMPFLPESPRYLMITKGDRDGAEKALKFIRQSNDVQADLEEMETEYQQSANNKNNSESEKYTMMRFLKTKELRPPLIITIMLQATQQLSGINAIFFYSNSIFLNAGVPRPAIQYAVVGTCAINVIMTIIAVPIMDKAGRRPLLLYPMSAMIIILGIIVAALKLQTTLSWMSYVSIACVIAYVICFSVGLGPIPSMLSAELFRQGPRPRAMSIGGLANWLFTLIVAISFELLQKLISEYTFIIFLIFLIGFIIFIYFKVPETKNKTFEEIASSFQKGGVVEVIEYKPEVDETQVDVVDTGKIPLTHAVKPAVNVDIDLKLLDNSHKELI